MYTKGKWELGHVSPWEIWVGADIHIADVHGKQEVRQANAHLIAAAPDLLEACKFAAECAKGPIEGMSVNEAAIEVREVLAAAIAKAEYKPHLDMDKWKKKIGNIMADAFDEIIK